MRGDGGTVWTLRGPLWGARTGPSANYPQIRGAMLCMLCVGAGGMAVAACQPQGKIWEEEGAPGQGGGWEAGAAGYCAPLLLKTGQV